MKIVLALFLLALVVGALWLMIANAGEGISHDDEGPTE